LFCSYLENVSKSGGWRFWVKWLKGREKRGGTNVAGNNGEIRYAKNIQQGTTRRDATGEREVAFLILIGPLPRIRKFDERLSTSSENKWMFYLGEEPHREALQAAEGRMA
jgi:hypothetical protein